MRQRWKLASIEDVEDVLSRLRPEDVEECFAMMGLSPQEHFDLIGYDPERTYVIFNAQGENVALAGLSPVDEHCAQIWMVATPLLEQHSIEFLKHSRAFIGEITRGYPLVFNWVYAANEVHIKWLKWCGFTFIQRHEKFGAMGVPFYTFVKVTQCASC